MQNYIGTNLFQEKSSYSFSTKFSKVLKLYYIKVVFKNLFFLRKKDVVWSQDLN